MHRLRRKGVERWVGLWYRTNGWCCDWLGAACGCCQLFSNWCVCAGVWCCPSMCCCRCKWQCPNLAAWGCCQVSSCRSPCCARALSSDAGNSPEVVVRRHNPYCRATLVSFTASRCHHFQPKQAARQRAFVAAMVKNGNPGSCVLSAHCGLHMRCGQQQPTMMLRAEMKT
jgi:hypothetical protein